jgi:hypothetical protein
MNFEDDSLWEVAPCSLVEEESRFRGRLIAMMMEAVRTFDMSRYYTALYPRRLPTSSSHLEDLKSHNMSFDIEHSEKNTEW